MHPTVIIAIVLLSLFNSTHAVGIDNIWAAPLDNRKSDTLYGDAAAPIVDNPKFQFNYIYSKPFWQHSWFVPITVTAVVAGNAVVSVMTGGIGAPAGTTASVAVLGMTVASVQSSTIASVVAGGGAGSYMAGLSTIGGWFGGNAMLGAMVLNGAVAAGGVAATGAAAYTTASLAQRFGMAPDLADMSKGMVTITTGETATILKLAVEGTQKLLLNNNATTTTTTTTTSTPPETSKQLSQQILTIGPPLPRRDAQIHAELVRLRLELADAKGNTLRSKESGLQQIYQVPVIMGDVYGSTAMKELLTQFSAINTQLQAKTASTCNQCAHDDKGNLDKRANLLLTKVRTFLQGLIGNSGDAAASPTQDSAQGSGENPTDYTKRQSVNTGRRLWQQLSAAEQQDFVGGLLLISQFQDNDSLVKFAQYIEPGFGTDKGFLWYLKSLALYKQGQALALTGNKAAALQILKQSLHMLDIAIESETGVIEGLMLKAILIDTLASEEPLLYAQLEYLAKRLGQYDKDYYVTPNTPAAAYELFGDVYRNAGIYNQALHQYKQAWWQAGTFDDNMEKAVLCIKIAHTYAKLGDKVGHDAFLTSGRNYTLSWTGYLGLQSQTERDNNAKNLQALYQALTTHTIPGKHTNL